MILDNGMQDNSFSFHKSSFNTVNLSQETILGRAVGVGNLELEGGREGGRCLSTNGRGEGKVFGVCSSIYIYIYRVSKRLIRLTD